MYDVIVVGGGASGMMAAGTAASQGKKVLLLEKNRTLGEKLKITGGGRCNITNAELDERQLLKAYGKAEQSLYSLFSQFGVQETFTFFESRGLPLVVEARKRAFPHTHKALDVFKVLESYLKKNGVEVVTAAPVTRVETDDSGAVVAVFCASRMFKANTFIFACGSVSHPETGSTGDGFKWLQNLGHTIHEPTPTIVPLRTEDAWIKKLSGSSMSDMKITFYSEGVKKFSEKGKVLFTHFGLSGPMILNSAHKVADLLHSGTVTALIDAYPMLDLGALEKKIITTFDANKNKALKNVLKECVPEGTSKGIQLLLETQIDTEKKVNLVSREERKLLVQLLKNLPVTVSGLMGFDRAVVADGGVPVEEVDMRTMRSRKIPNIFLTGDLLHINRPSGGFSLQLCWSTGFVAGTNA